MRISHSSSEPKEPTVLKDGLKATYLRLKCEFHSEFRVTARDEFGDDILGVEMFDDFYEALREFVGQKSNVDAGQYASTEIEVVLRWDDAEGLVEWEEIEIYHYGRREFADPHAEE